VSRFIPDQDATNAPLRTMATTAIAGSRNHCMEQLISAMGGLISFVSQNIMFVLISAVALLIVPGVLTW
jgi:hypothetical protein